MNASGGAAAPVVGDSEEYGTNEPKKDSTSADTQQDGSGSGGSSTVPAKRTASDHTSQSGLEQKFTKLNRDEVALASASTEEQERDARAQRRADAVGESRSAGSDEAQRFGGHADVEELHGPTSLAGADKSEERGGKGGNVKSESGSGSGSSEKQNADANHAAKTNKKGGDAEMGGKRDELEQIQRRKAEKFGGVNLGDN
jgi:hypothetical protein